MQQVNLLTEELAPKRDPLMGVHLLMVWGAFVGLLAVFTGWQGITMSWMESDLTAVKSEVQQIQSQNANLKSSAEQRSAALESDLERLRREQIERMELVAILSGHRVQDGFSGHLTSLARAHVEGLWLSEIRFDQTLDQDSNNIHLKGAALAPQRVPEYLLNIADDQHFAGQRFDQFLLEVEEGLVEFELVGIGAADHVADGASQSGQVASVGPG
jgi:hypothetical protein